VEEWGRKNKEKGTNTCLITTCSQVVIRRTLQAVVHQTRQVEVKVGISVQEPSQKCGDDNNDQGIPKPIFQYKDDTT